MYTSHSISYQVAQEKQRSLMAEAARERRARQARPAPVAQPAASHRSRRTWRLVPQLRPQAQS